MGSARLSSQVLLFFVGNYQYMCLSSWKCCWIVECAILKNNISIKGQGILKYFIYIDNLPILSYLTQSPLNPCKKEVRKYVFVNAYMHISRGSQWAGCIYEALFLWLFSCSSNEYSMGSEREAFAAVEPKRKGEQRENVPDNSHTH